MSSPTDLQDLMHRALRDTPEPDAERLAHLARRRGLAIRRRRQALGLVGVAASCALVLGGIQVVRDLEPLPDGSAAGQATAPEPVVATGPMTAAVLVELLEQTADGTVVRVAGRSNGSERAGTFAEVWWQPADGSGVSAVSVRVAPVRSWERDPAWRCADAADCEATWPPPRASVNTLREVVEEIEVQTVATHERQDDVRVRVSVANGRFLADGFDRSRPLPALSEQQVRHIAESPVFGLLVDPVYAEPGRTPEDYLDLDDDEQTIVVLPS